LDLLSFGWIIQRYGDPVPVGNDRGKGEQDSETATPQGSRKHLVYIRLEDGVCGVKKTRRQQRYTKSWEIAMKKRKKEPGCAEGKDRKKKPSTSMTPKNQRISTATGGGGLSNGA